MYVGMLQFGSIGIDEITDYDGSSIDGIRVTFHENEIEPAFELGKKLIKKGYKVFMQPVGTTSYKDDSLVTLINRINVMKPYAFYIVDTLGKMYKNDLLHMFYLVDHNLDQRIALGFHSHNNLQLSFANAQELTQTNTKRNIIIDTSVLGMGRGAGNLNTELMVQYLNVNRGFKYDVLNIMNVMDQYIKPFSLIYKWGYDPAYYLAAVTDCHPNYASFLLNMQTLQIRDIATILNSLDKNKQSIFDKEYIQSQYNEYMDHTVDDSEVMNKLSESIKDKKVLLLAPGKSLKNETKKINSLITSGEYIVVCINFSPSDIPVDFLFISNMKRFNSVKQSPTKRIKTIVTSNIVSFSDDYLVVNYSSYLNEDPIIIDNAGIMCINMLMHVGVKDFLLVGFDGFSENLKENYFEESLCLNVEQERLARINIAMASKIKQLKKLVNIEFFSLPNYYVGI